MSLILLGILNSQVTAGGAGAYDLLETQVLSSSAASVTFSGLGSYTDYKHLQIRAVVRSTESGSQTGAWAMRFNGVTTNSYARHTLEANGTNITSDAYPNNTMIELREITGNSAASGSFAASVIDILDFASTTKNTTTRMLHGLNSGTEYRVGLSSGAFFSTAAITSIQLFDQYSNLQTGSRFSLYGVK